MKTIILLWLTLVLSQCSCKTLPEEEMVVSVYTTPAAPEGNGTLDHLDVYKQIANNIAERITSPIYRFLGIEKNKTENPQPVTKRNWEKIELLDEPEDVTAAVKTVNNDISDDRDVEELNNEAMRKIFEKKPEKFTIFSSYLPVKENLDLVTTDKNVGNDEGKNDTMTDGIDDDDLFTLNEVDTKQGREGPFVFVLEWFGSLIQLVWGAFQAIFKPSTSNKE